MSTNAKITALPGTLPAWSFADRLRKARREYTSFTQQQMADALEVGLKAYSAWESGKNQHPQNVIEIANKLNELTGIPRTWFLGWEDDGTHQSPESRSTPRTLVPKIVGSAEVTDINEYRASVAQGIEHQFPVLRAAGSNPAGGTEQLATVTPIRVIA